MNEAGDSFVYMLGTLQSLLNATYFMSGGVLWPIVVELIVGWHNGKYDLVMYAS